MLDSATIRVQYTRNIGSGTYETIGLEVHGIGAMISVHGGSEVENSACLMMPPNAARALAAALREMADQVEAEMKGRVDHDR